jgi:prolyl 4-hydroxylase
MYYVVVLLLVFLAGLIYFMFFRPKGRGFCATTAPWTPPQVLAHFLTPEERLAILAKAGPLFEESQVVTGKDTKVRKSETAWIERDDPVVYDIMERACRLCNMPFENCEKMQVVKYGPDGYYNAHYDASCDDLPESIEFEKNGGQRLVTVLCYLNDDFEGGATQFPNLGKDYKVPTDGALLFYSLQTPESGNQCHPLSLHAGMPVTRGQKYICNIWIRERAYTP